MMRFRIYTTCRRVIGLLCGVAAIAMLVRSGYLKDQTYKQKKDGMPMLPATKKFPKAEDLPDVRHIAFLKVHRTGSSTVQNIFLRFGMSRHLTFILPSIEYNECHGTLTCISYTRTLHDGNIAPPPKDKSYEIVCSDVVYDRQAFQKYLPRDTRYIGLVRDPIRRLESHMRSIGLLRGVPLAKYADNPIRYNTAMSNNRMAFEFGLKKEWFPDSSHKSLSETEEVEVNEHVNQIMKEFDLILVLERLDESLVLMKRILRWNITDIIYPTNFDSEQYNHFKNGAIESMKNYLYLDFMLYDNAVSSLNTKIAETGPDFPDEVKMFQGVNAKVNKFCDCQYCPIKSVSIKATKWNSAVRVDKNFCKNLLLKDVKYFKQIRARQQS